VHRSGRVGLWKEITKTVLEFGDFMGKGGVDVGEVGVGGIGGRAKGVAKEACTGDYFSGSVPRILFNV
jgi:hypothetical protein